MRYQLGAILNLHVHDVVISRNQFVAYPYRGLEGDIGFLHGNHAVFQTHTVLPQLKLFSRGFGLYLSLVNVI